MASFALRYAALAAMACWFAAGTVPHVWAQDANGKPNASAPSSSAGSQSGEAASSIERDPFRACVAAHKDDPMRHQNCDWSGNYSNKH